MHAVELRNIKCLAGNRREEDRFVGRLDNSDDLILLLERQLAGKDMGDRSKLIRKKGHHRVDMLSLVSDDDLVMVAALLNLGDLAGDQCIAERILDQRLL